MTPAIRDIVLRPVWTPSDPGDCVAWWDAADRASIGHLYGNDAVSRWIDKSGKGNHAVQTGAATRKPTMRLGQQNGLPLVSFDGGDDLSCDAIAAYFTGEDKPGTMIAVLRRSVYNVYQYVATCGPNASGGVARYFLAGYQNSDAARCERKDDAGNSFGNTAALGVTDTVHILSTVHAPTTTSIWVNGVNKQNAGAADVGAMTLDNFHLGCWRTDLSKQSYLDGAIGEVLIWRKALDTQARRRVERYLGAKWGINVA